MKKTDLLEAFKSIQKDIGPKKVTNLVNKDVLIAAMKGKKAEYVSDNNKKENFITNIKAEIKTPKVENREWRPRRTSIEEISKRLMFEAEMESRKSNAFRLNLQPIVLDITHAKFGITRNNKAATVELLYPNANDKISLKIQVDGAEDKLVELGLDDEAYRNNLGEYIIKLVDESIEETNDNNQSNIYDSGSQDPTEKNTPEAPLGTGIDGRGSNIGTGSPIWESDRRRMNSLISLIEAEKEDEEETVAEPADESSDLDAFGDLGGDKADGDEAAGDVNADGDFTEKDFAIDAGADTTTGDTFPDIGGGGGGSSAGGLSGLGDIGGSKEGGSDVNAEKDQMAGTDDVNYTTFRDKTDWLQSSLDTMQNLVAQSMGQKMQEGKGVILTSDEILNGSPGLRNVDKPIDIVDKFLQIYTELDNVDLTEEQLAEIEEKLALNDNKFDGWLAEKLSEFTHEGDVNETLSNDMFEDYKPMGGEPEPTPGTGEMGFDEFIDKTTPTEENPQERKEAELELGLPPEISEFSNISGEKEEIPEKEIPKEEEEKEEEKK